jgi:hypothetical protein
MRDDFHFGSGILVASGEVSYFGHGATDGTFCALYTGVWLEMAFFT